MKEIVVNGKRCFEWEPHEAVQRTAFEECFVGQESVNLVMEALLMAMKKAARERKVAWESMTNLLPEEFRHKKIQYRFIEGRVQVDD